MEMHQNNDALDNLKQALDIYKNISPNQQKDANIAMTLNNIGNCLMKAHQFDYALIYLKNSLEVYNSLNQQENVARTHKSIGDSLMDMQQYDEALSFFKMAVSHYQV